MLQLRNSPDPDCNVSPAQIVFGRPIRDAFAFASRLNKFTNDNIRPEWREAWRLKEMALKNRFHRTVEGASDKPKQPQELHAGDRCYIQNQVGAYPKRWDRSGTVVAVHPFHSYSLKVDGSGRITRRNRRFLRKFTPAATTMHPAPAGPSAPPMMAPPAPAGPSAPPMMAPTNARPSASPPHSNPAPITHRRQKRVSRPPKRYDPESGRWV